MKFSIGKLDLIIGCMFSGKTTELQNRIKVHKCINNEYVVLNHSIDTRYSTSNISSHDLIHTNCISLDDLLTFKDTEA